MTLSWSEGKKRAVPYFDYIYTAHCDPMGSIRGFTPYSERIGQYQNLNRREPNISKPAKQILQSLVKWTADPSSMVPYGLAGSFFVALGLPSLFADFLPWQGTGNKLAQVETPDPPTDIGLCTHQGYSRRTFEKICRLLASVLTNCTTAAISWQPFGNRGKICEFSGKPGNSLEQSY